MQNDEQKIRDLVQMWMQATEEKDLNTILNFIDDDALFMVPGEPPFGKKEFVAGFEQMKNIKLQGTSEIQELKLLGDWAWIRNFIRMKLTPANGKTVERSGYALTILKKNSSGKWVLTRDANLIAPDNEAK